MEESPGGYSGSSRTEAILTKDVLRQYVDLLREADEVRERISRTEKELQRIIDEGEVTDMVRGGEGGIQHFSITGFPIRDFSKKRTLLRNRKIMLLSLESEIEETLNDVYEFITQIPSSYDRRIVSLRIIDKMTWRQIAQALGGNNTEDSVRKYFERFLEKN